MRYTAEVTVRITVEAQDAVEAQEYMMGELDEAGLASKLSTGLDIINLPVPTITSERPGRQYITLREKHVGNAVLHAFGRAWLAVNFIGRIMQQDVGKRVYLVGDILQVENDAQRDARLATQR